MLALPLFLLTPVIQYVELIEQRHVSPFQVAERWKDVAGASCPAPSATSWPGLGLEVGRNVRRFVQTACLHIRPVRFPLLAKEILIVNAVMNRFMHGLHGNVIVLGDLFW